MKKVLNSNYLKFIAIFAMLIDHIAYAFVSNVFLYIIMRCIGRICAPIMFYSIAKGYLHTRNKAKYGMRLFGFAVVSQIPYSLFVSSELFLVSKLNILFTLFLGYLCLIILNSISDRLTKYSLIVLCVLISCFCDWGIVGIIFVLLFWIFRNSNYKYVVYSICSLLYICLLCLFEKNFVLFMCLLGLFLVIPLLYLDNGYKGNKNIKYLFYLFYPLHLLILYVIKLFV